MTGETIKPGDTVQRRHGDAYMRAERGRVLYIREARARVRWYCAGGAHSDSTVKVTRLRRAEQAQS